MSYREAMEAAGAKVLAMKDFGSYQGDWWAKVEFDGQLGWVNGSFGSCSHCDAFEAEFGWSYEDEPDAKERLAKFGASYLNQIMTQDEAEARVRADIERGWAGVEEEAMLSFLLENSFTATLSTNKE